MMRRHSQKALGSSTTIQGNMRLRRQSWLAGNRKVTRSIPGFSQCESGEVSLSETPHPNCSQRAGCGPAVLTAVVMCKWLHEQGECQAILYSALSGHCLELIYHLHLQSTCNQRPKQNLTSLLLTSYCENIYQQCCFLLYKTLNFSCQMVRTVCHWMVAGVHFQLCQQTSPEQDFQPVHIDILYSPACQTCECRLTD